MEKKTTESAVVATRAEKKDATKNLIREILTQKQYKHNDLIDEVSKAYAQRFGGENSENINDVKGRVGSVLDIMKKDGDVLYGGGMYALKEPSPAETPKKSTGRGRKKVVTEQTDDIASETDVAVKKSTKKQPKKSGKLKETAESVPTTTENPETAVTEKNEGNAKNEEIEQPKKRGRKPKTSAVSQSERMVQEAPKTMSGNTSNGTPMVALNSTPVSEEPPMVEVKKSDVENAPMVETKKEEVKKGVPVSEVKTENAVTVKEKGEIAPQNTVMDISFLLGNVNKTAPKTEKNASANVARNDAKPSEERFEKTPKTKAAVAIKTEEKPRVQAEPQRPERVTEKKDTPKPKADEKREELPVVEEPATDQKSLRVKRGSISARRAANKPKTEEEKLREKFLHRLRSLGGDYFEYYSVYLLERYSRKNGRRMESFCVSGGDLDGGIDGLIEVTDPIGFRETIYIQSKNWNPDRGNEKFWVVGENLLQQFLGACLCRKVRDGKQHTRGIFITTSYFTPEAKRILKEMSDSVVGYDADDVFEAAKECEFGLIRKNGTWQLDEELLSGMKAFYRMS